MKYKILVILIFCAFCGWGQRTPSIPKPVLTPPEAPDPASFLIVPFVDYFDPATLAATWVEAWMVKNVAEANSRTGKEFASIAATALAEHLGRGHLKPARQEIRARDYVDLCGGFTGGALNRNKGLCDAKKAYILEASRVVNLLIRAGTRYKVNNGVLDQIGEKYTAIINTLRYELDEMKIAREKRRFLQNILN